MAKRTKTITKSDRLNIVADRGYYKGEEILGCGQASITTYIPKPQTSGNRAKGFFSKSDFIYDQATDSFKYPGGHKAVYRFNYNERPGHIVRKYWASACSNCKLKSKCTTEKSRRLSRWEHDDVLYQVEIRLAHSNDIMRIRRSTV